MQPGRVFMKEHPSRAVKHRGSMVRIPATPLNTQLQWLIHHSLETHTHSCICACALKHTQPYHPCTCVFLWFSEKLHKLIVKCSVND